VSTRHRMARGAELAGVEERGMHTRGFPRNLGDLIVSAPTDREGARLNSPCIEEPTTRGPPERSTSGGAVLPREGNETRWDGRAGVGAPHSTVEAGERTRADPGEGRGCRTMDPVEGKMTGTPSPDTISTRLQRIAARVHDGVTVAQQTHDLTSRMRQSRTSGSVGAPGR
jgi:hypothetical protein